MVSGEFFIHGGGRWRAVDDATGRVEGWGRARFVVARGGRLEAARAAGVLTALRALAAGQRSAARAGPPLPYKYPRPKESTTRDGNRAGCQRAGCQRAGCQRADCLRADCQRADCLRADCQQVGCQPADCQRAHRRCCHHDNNGKSYTSKATGIAARSAVPCGKREGAPRGAAGSPRGAAAAKRDRDSTSSEEPARTVTTVATVHSPGTPQPKRRKQSTSSMTSDCVELKRKLSSASATKESRRRGRSPVARRGPSPAARAANSLKRKRGSSPASIEHSPVLKSRKICKSNYFQSDSKKPLTRADTAPSDRSSSKRRTRQNISLVISSDESVLETNNRSENLKPSKSQTSSRTNVPVKHKLSPERVTVESSTDEPVRRQAGTERAAVESSTDRSAPRRARDSRPEIGLQVDSQQDACKELVIDERDVEILRLFLQKHYPDEELLRFDTDNEYKKMHFYQINPLVSVERCSLIEQMIHSKSRRNLIDFASNLGLRSVSEPLTRRSRRRTERSHAARDTHSTTDDKENMTRRAATATRARRGDVLKESVAKERNRERDKPRREDKKINVNSETKKEQERREVSKTRGNKESPLVKPRESINMKQPEPRVDTVGLRSKPVVGASAQQKAGVSKPRPKPRAAVSTERPRLKEYSNLEDHAIVSWVSAGERAFQVNGNRLWRALQDQYGRITGQGRTWHSLRNRYLRYILPRLSALALPPPQQRRLRAAAATGELKANKMAPRRNSIFTLPPRGASSRAASPRRPRVASAAESEGPPRNAASARESAEGSKPPRRRRRTPLRAARAPPPPRTPPSGRRAPSGTRRRTLIESTKRKTARVSASVSASSESASSEPEELVAPRRSLRGEALASVPRRSLRSEAPAPAETHLRMRRLFNPKAVL